MSKQPDGKRRTVLFWTLAVFGMLLLTAALRRLREQPIIFGRPFLVTIAMLLVAIGAFCYALSIRSRDRPE